MNKRDLITTYGTDAAGMTKCLLAKSGLADMIPSGARIGIKPNLVVAKPHDSGATTSPVIVEALIDYLQQHGHQNIIILEGAWIGASTRQAFKVCGYDQLAAKYKVSLFDTKSDSYERVTAGPFPMEISRTALELDFLINVPVLKGHCQTKITGALKNMKGCLSDKEKRHFHTLGLHKPIAYLNPALRQDFILVDSLCGDLDFEEGGNPVQMNCIFCGLDPVLVDSYIASVIGYAPEEIDYIKTAEKLGLGSSDLKKANIITLTHDRTPAQKIHSRKAEHLAACIREKDACSACYANLIRALARLDEEGMLPHFRSFPVYIGQGWKNIAGKGTGIGTCTKGFTRCAAGCPPPASAILEVLHAELSGS